MEKLIWKATGGCLLLWSIFQQYRPHESDPPCRCCHIYQEIEQSMCLSGQFIFSITGLVDQFLYWLKILAPPRNILSMLLKALLSLQRCHWIYGKGEKLQHPSNLWTHTIDASDPDDKCQFEFFGYIEVARVFFAILAIRILVCTYAYILCDSS